MSTLTDRQLLARYVSSRSDDEAFAELLRGHADWVYSAARRLVRDPQHTDDVTQAVFILLAQKAHRIRDAASLRGWLLKVTRYTADHILRSERRRQQHERRAAAMRPEASGAADPQWEQISAMLDELVARLSFADRDAILLRFYQRKSMAEVGAELAVSEDTAKKRVARATERLRGLLARRGVTLPAAALGAALIANTTQAAPVAISAVTSSGGPLALAKGASTMMTLAKMKMAAAAAVLFLLVAGAGMAVVGATAGQHGTTAVAVVPLATSVRAEYAASDTPGLKWSNDTTSITPESNAVFHGEFSNKAVTATLENLAAHDFLQISVQLLIIRSWDGALRSTGGPRVGPDYFRMGLDDGDPGAGRTLVHATFSNTPVMSGFTPGGSFQTYPSPVPGERVSYMTGADFKNNFGYLYPSGGNQPPFNIHEDSVYTLKMTVPHTAEKAVLSFRGMGLQSAHDESWGVMNVHIAPRTKEQFRTRIGEKETFDTFTDADGTEIKLPATRSFAKLLQAAISHDATVGNEAFWDLVGGSDATVDFLARTVKPVKVDLERIKKLAASIYEDDVPKDETDPRVQALVKLGISAEPAIRDLREEKKESPSRLDRVLMEEGIMTVDDADTRQWIVATRLLEAIGTPAAKKARVTLMGQ